MSKVENLQTINRAKPFPCVSVALAVLAMFVLSWLAAQGVRNNLQPLLIFAGLCLPIFIAELRNHHNKWAIIVFNAVPVITYAFGYLVLRGPVLTGSMVLWLAGFGVTSNAAPHSGRKRLPSSMRSASEFHRRSVENLRRRWRFVFQSPAAKRFGAITARSSAGRRGAEEVEEASSLVLCPGTL